jgi:hypothetical protein
MTFDKVMAGVSRLTGALFASGFFVLAVLSMDGSLSGCFWAWLFFFNGIGTAAFFGVFSKKEEGNNDQET